ncbi:MULTISPECIES: hypothetical protein [unclassified Sphingomonas]|uniref:hypothetical protein n=2 Tax=unclassified Sphingomonas TaxID=196159 RepID=UPI0012E37EBE|nr:MULTISPECIES: hypothetical protein [unclassified Sphingomonas]
MLMYEILTFGLICVIGLSVFLVLAKGQLEHMVAETTKQATDEQLAELQKLGDFHETMMFPAVVGPGVAIAPKSELFAITLPGHRPRLYHFSQLVAAEVDRNGTTLTTTKGKISTGGAALGTLIAGPVGGLLIGAKTSSTSQSQERVELALKLYVNDLYSPCFSIPFGAALAVPHDPAFQKLTGKVDLWFGRFRAILADAQPRQEGGTHPKAIIHAGPPSPLPVASTKNRIFAP